MENTIMTVREVAAYLRVNERTVINMINRGTLRATKVGKIWRIKREELDSLFTGIEDVDFPDEKTVRQDTISKEKRGTIMRIVEILEKKSEEEVQQFYSMINKDQ